MTDLQEQAFISLAKAFIEAGMNRELAEDNAKNCLAACIKEVSVCATQTS